MKPKQLYFRPIPKALRGPLEQYQQSIFEARQFAQNEKDAYDTPGMDLHTKAEMLAWTLEETIKKLDAALKHYEVASKK